MTRSHLTARITAAIVLIGVLLTGCSSVDNLGGSVPQAEQRAREMSAAGNHEAASQMYERLAGATSGEQRETYRILSGYELVKARQPERARDVLRKIKQPVAESNRILWAVVAAEFRLLEGRPDEALKALDSAPDYARNDPEILRVTAMTRFRLGQPEAAVAALVEREVWLDDGQSIAANRDYLWTNLQTFGRTLPPTPSSSDNTVAGWVALGYLNEQDADTPSAFRQSLLAWRQQYPNHPANDALLPELLSGLRAELTFPARVAVLLPLSGRQQAAAEAVRDGFLAGWFDLRGETERPDVRVYDTTDGVVDARRQALADGADFIVGPLLRDEVSESASMPAGVSQLALNYLPDGEVAPTDFWQLALSPDDEAAQAARRGVADGHGKAVVLVPNNNWGRRLLTTYTSELESLGGTVLDYRTYEPSSVDFSSTIRGILLLGESQARRDRLSSILGQPLSFEPRRRGDIELIFMAATTNVAGLLAPQLQFNFAGDLPTYSTSAIYQAGAQANRDLEGVMFPDIPLIVNPDISMQQLRGSLLSNWPGQADRRLRLYALGYDAFRLTPLVYGGQLAQNPTVSGTTGVLRPGSNGRINRELAWARIESGRAVPVQDVVTFRAPAGAAD